MNFTRLFFLSVLLNATLGLLLWMRPASPPIPAQTEVSKSLSSAAAFSSPLPAPAAPAPSPFSWRRVEAEDCLTYISNLRAISCPETTVHTIIAAKLDSAYEAKRRELQIRARSGNMTTAEFNQELEQFEMEKNRELALLFGSETSAALASQASTDPDSQADPTATESDASTSITAPLPLISYSADSSHVALEPWQQEEVQRLIVEFTTAVGGPDQNPDDPAYLDRWNHALDDFNERVRTKLGTEAYGALLGAAQAIPPPIQKQ